MKPISKPGLCIFTTTFPFGNGEAFLETELTYLHPHFAPIIIFPFVAGGVARKLPDGVVVDLTLAQGRPKSILLRIMQSTLASLSSPLFFSELIASPSILLQPAKIARLVAHVGDTCRMFRMLKNTKSILALEHESLILYSYWLNRSALAISLLKKQFPRIVTVARTHNSDLYREQLSPPYIPLQQKTLEELDSVFTISEHGRQYLLADFPKLQEKTILSYLGVNAPSNVVERAFELDTFRVVTCSYLKPRKRVQLFIAGLHLFAVQHADVAITWHHFGDGPLFAQLKESAAKLPPNVTVSFPGHVPNAHILEFYQEHAVDTFVNVSEWEGIPVTIMEAQSYGIPVIATSACGIPEIVNNTNGILLDEHPTPQQIADALAEMLSTGEAKRQISKADWDAKYNAEKNYPRFVEQLYSLLSPVTPSN